MLKTIILVVGTSLFVSTPLIAQRLDEITASVGVWSNFRLGKLSPLGVFANGSTKSYERSNIRDAGAYFLTYHHKFSKAFIMGFAFGIEQDKGEFSDNASSTKGQYEKRAITIGIEGKYLYYTGGGIRVYGMAALGTRFDNQKQMNYYINAVANNTDEFQTIAFTYHIAPIGIRAGRRFGAFAEVGYGYKGIINLGLSLRF